MRTNKLENFMTANKLVGEKSKKKTEINTWKTYSHGIINTRTAIW